MNLAAPPYVGASILKLLTTAIQDGKYLIYKPT